MDINIDPITAIALIFAYASIKVGIAYMRIGK